MNKSYIFHAANTHYSGIESKMLMIGSDNNSSKWGGGVISQNGSMH